MMRVLALTRRVRHGWTASAVAVLGIGALGLTVGAGSAVAAGVAPARSAPAGHKGAALHVGRRIASAADQPQIVRPHGLRMRSEGTTDLSYSGNWSGLAGTGTGIEGAAGDWTVPSVRQTGQSLYSSSWVGVDGDGNSDLIQTGTEQDASDGYYAWIEILPAASEPIVSSDGDLAPVEPGDSIEASVAEASSGVWTIFIQDNTQDWYFEQNFDYGGPGQSAEWIEEAPTINGAQSVPPNFGTVHFSETSVYGNFGSGTGWYSTDMDASNEIAMENQAGTHLLAVPTAPSKESSSGQHFNDSYVTAPGAPTGLRGTAKIRAVGLTWKTPSSTGGSPIYDYTVREYLNGSLRRTLTTKSTSLTVTGLTAGGRYQFSVADLNIGAYASGFTGKTGVIKPKG